MKKETIQKVINFVITVLTAVLSAFCVQSCASRKHPTPIAIQLHPQCLLGIQSILRNWTFLIFKQV